MVKNLPAMWRPGFDPWIRKIPWRREWLPTLVFSPGEFHGQRSLSGYSLWDHKESDMTEQLTCIKQITKKDLLYTTENSTQYSVIAYMGKESETHTQHTHTYISELLCYTPETYTIV